METFLKISRILDQLAEAKGKEKVQGLQRHVDDPDFRIFVQMCLDADRQYYINKLPVLARNGDGDSYSFQEALEILGALCVKGSATNTDKSVVAAIAQQSPEALGVVTCMLKKDLRCGVGEKQIIAVDPEWIFVVPYCRCSKEDKLGRIDYPAIVQKKADGGFAYGFEEPHARTGKHFLTRNGSGFDLAGVVEPQVCELSRRIREQIDYTEGIVTIGELVFKGEDGKHLDRKTSNGHLSRFLSGTGTRALAETVEYVLWGWLPRSHFDSWSSDIEYEDVFNVLRCALVPGTLANISLIESEKVDHEQGARDFFRGMRGLGYEGAILKDRQATWSWGTSTEMIKLKNAAEAEFRIIDAYEGEGKYKGMLGGIVIGSEEGKILTRCGSGFSDEERGRGVQWWRDRAGGIVTVRFIEVIDDKPLRETKCLSNPSFVETRFNEKTVADTLSYCLSQC
jgi:hypothetical protein